MSDRAPSGARRRRKHRRMDRYYRDTNPALERVKAIGTALFVVGGTGFLVWVFVFYR